MSNGIPNEYQRFNVIERIQHVILFTTFLILAFTGWALKYPEPMLEHAGWWIKMWGGSKNRGYHPPHSRHYDVIRFCLAYNIPCIQFIHRENEIS